MRACRSTAVLVLVALAATPALADWKDDYSRGLEAVRDGRWGEAARYMESALAGNAQPAARLRLYGQRYEVYAPQHYAGLAALRQGNCAAALRYWDQGANRAFVSANAQLADVEQRGRADCGSALASEAKPATEPTPTPAPPVTASTPSAQGPLAKPPAAQQPVAQTRPAPAPVQTPPPAAKPPVAVEQRATVSAAAEALRPALDAYLTGRYAEVLRLSARPAGDPRVGWHLQTLRAAAAFQLSQLGSSEPSDATTIARQAVSEARRLDAGRRPDATFYSPKFVAFYNTP